ncbi:FAD binding domain-containing protein [Roseomonas sp. WA12]
MQSFTLNKARSLPDALAAAQSGGRYIAGGTTLVDLMREEVELPERLVDINALPLRFLRSGDEAAVIGALCRMSEVAAHPGMQREQPLVVEALIQGASPQLRNMASVGGNLLQRVRCPYFRMRDASCNKRAPGSGCAALTGTNNGHALLGTSPSCIATHPSDLAVALVALEASITLTSSAGERSLLVEQLYRLPGDTPHLEHWLRPGEIITAIHVPGGLLARQGRYLKVRDRASYEFAVVSVAASLVVEDGLIRAARVAAGGVGTIPWRLRACEDALVGQPQGRAAFETAARLAIEGARPMSGNHFKLDLLPRTLVRALEMTGGTT